MSDELLVWWTSQADCEQIGQPVYDEDATEYPEGLPAGCVLMSELPMPDYVKGEYSSRGGRAGRGRLWIPEGIDLPGGVLWGSGEIYDRAERCAGIVFRAADLPIMGLLPGFITDPHMNIVTLEGEASKAALRIISDLQARNAELIDVLQLWSKFESYASNKLPMSLWQALLYEQAAAATHTLLCPECKNIKGGQYCTHIS